MGSLVSKVEAANPTSIVITQGVRERWEAMYLQQIQAEKAKEAQTTSDSNSKNQDEGQQEPSSSANFDKLDSTAKESQEKVPSESGREDAKTDTNGETHTDKTERTTSSPSSSSAVENLTEVQDGIAPNSENMVKFSNFFIPHRSGSKVQHDLENGNDEDYLPKWNSETRFSSLERKEVEAENSVLYEEIDETFDENDKSVQEDFLDEEAIIGSEPVRPFAKRISAMKEVRVPKPVLPIVLDQDEEGKVTVETINAWKLKHRFEKEISRNNAYWAQEMDKITAKIENETRKEADDFQSRVEQLRRKHYADIEPPFRDGAHCNLLVPQISKCYQQNTNQVLKCNNLVRQFAQCTNKSV